jgi:4-hydroxybenzoate polyprenyltransferase
MKRIMLKWLQLLRLPTVFTAMADVFCGFFIADFLTTDRASDWTVLPWLLISSAGLYLGGMVLNDVFDARLDAIERPERPIPSGRISRASASAAGGLLLLVGILAAGAAWLAVDLVGQVPMIAVLIAVTVLSYDIYLKSTWTGPFGMAVCRFLNLSLGAGTAIGVSGNVLAWQFPVLGASCGLAVYIVGVTWFARNEAGNASRLSLAGGLTVAVLGVTVTATTVLSSQNNRTIAAIGLAQFAAIVLVTIGRGIAAIQNGQSGLLQRTVGKMLLWIIILDGATVFAVTGDAVLEGLILLLVVPATLLRKRIAMSQGLPFPAQFAARNDAGSHLSCLLASA